nr:MAG TPA: hypothetical protein [Caudoviricetes sp.]
MSSSMRYNSVSIAFSSDMLISGLGYSISCSFLLHVIQHEVQFRQCLPGTFAQIRMLCQIRDYSRFYFLYFCFVFKPDTIFFFNHAGCSFLVPVLSMRRTDGLKVCAIATYNKGDNEVLRLYAAWKAHGVDFFLSLSYTLLTGAHQRRVKK